MSACLFISKAKVREIHNLWYMMDICGTRCDPRSPHRVYPAGYVHSTKALLMRWHRCLASPRGVCVWVSSGMYETRQKYQLCLCRHGSVGCAARNPEQEHETALISPHAARLALAACCDLTLCNDVSLYALGLEAHSLQVPHSWWRNGPGYTCAEESKATKAPSGVPNAPPCASTGYRISSGQPPLLRKRECNHITSRSSSDATAPALC